MHDACIGTTKCRNILQILVPELQGRPTLAPKPLNTNQHGHLSSYSSSLLLRLRTSRFDPVASDFHYTTRAACES